MQKPCNACGVVKSLDEFHKNKARKDGHVGICKECACAKSRKWNAENADRKHESGKNWHEKNRAKANAGSKAWREAHPEEFKAVKRKWYEEHKEYHQERTRAWFDAHPDREREIKWLSSYKARADYYEFDPVVGEGAEAVTVSGLMERWGDACFHCEDGQFEVLDHYPVPVCRGGAHSLSNVRPACDRCNSMMRDHLETDEVFYSAT